MAKRCGGAAQNCVWSGNVAEKVCSEMSWLADMYMVDVIVEGHFERLPSSWRSLKHFTVGQWARILDIGRGLSWPTTSRTRDPPPLSVLCLRKLAANLSSMACPKSESSLRNLASFLGVSLQELNGHFTPPKYDTRGVKEKKRGELDNVAGLVNGMRARHSFGLLLDVGAGLGHLSRLLAQSCADLRVRAVDANEALVLKARKIDERTMPAETDKLQRHVCFISEKNENNVIPDGVESNGGVCMLGLHACGDLSSSILRCSSSASHASAVLSFGCCYHKLNGGKDKPHQQQWHSENLECKDEMAEVPPGFPLSHRFSTASLSYAARELACHSLAAFVRNINSKPSDHVHHARRAVAEWLIVRAGGTRHLGLRSLPRPSGEEDRDKALDFPLYLSHALQSHPDTLARVHQLLSSEDPAVTGSALQRQLADFESKSLALYCLRLLLAPFVECLILEDRRSFLEENGFDALIHPLFDPLKSPRNCAVIGFRKRIPI